MTTDNLSCLQPFDGDNYRAGNRIIEHADFALERNDRVIVSFVAQSADQKSSAVAYVRVSDGTWVADTSTSEQAETDDHSVDVSVRQDMNHPPVLVAKSTLLGNSREILDPNPQLHNVEIAQVAWAS